MSISETGTAGAAIGVVVVAAGTGTRAGGPPKQYRLLAGRSVLSHALGPFLARSDVADVVVAIAPGAEADFAAAIAGLADPRLRRVSGGASRTQSVRAGLEALAAGPHKIAAVLIHDAARPAVTPAVIDRVLAALLTHDGAAPALPVTDALWRAGPAGADAALDRTGLVQVQTPQGFRLEPLLAAYRALGPESVLADDVAVARAAGLSVALPAGDADNVKLTWPEDFSRLEARLDARGPARFATGHGYDVHRLGPGDGVTLCGVKIAGARSLIGHSDADVGLHALTDAILGALAAGDIGDHFPPSDPRWRGADSRRFLRHAVEIARAAGARIAHADVTLVCERPKIKPHRAAMRETMAADLGLAVDRVSVKATTSERLGFTGREEGIAAFATATLGWG